MNTFAQLGIEFISKGADQAASDISRVQQAADGAEKSTTKLTTTSKRLATDAMTEAKSVKRVTDELERMTGVTLKFNPQANRTAAMFGEIASKASSGVPAIRSLTSIIGSLAAGFGIAGIAVGVVSGGIENMVASMFRASDSAAEYAKRVGRLNDALSAHEKYAEAFRRTTVDVVGEVSRNTQAMQALYETMAQVERMKIQSEFANLQKSLAPATREITNYVAELDQYQKSATQGTLQLSKLVEDQLKDRFGLTVAQAKNVKTATDEVTAALGSSNASGAAGAAQRLAEALLQARDQSGQIPKEILDVADRTGQWAEATYRVASVLGETDSATVSTGSSLETVTAKTNAWADMMNRVRAEISGIEGAIARIGGGLISGAAKRVEIEALRAGKSVGQARLEAEKFKAATEYDARINAAVSGGTIFGIIEAQNLQMVKAIDLGNIALDGQLETARKASTEAERLAKKATAAGVAGAKKAASASKKLTDQLDREADKWRANLGPIEKYQSEMAKLERVRSRLTGGEYAKAIKDMNVELADSLPLVGDLTDALVNGLFDGFKGGMKNILGVFKNWLAQMISIAAKNRIVMSAGFAGSGAGAAVAGGVPGMGGIGGMGSGLLSGVGGAFSAFGAGVSGFATALGSGGLGGALAYTNVMLSGATTGLTGLASAAGALALPLAGIAAVFSFFRSKTKLLDSGLRITATNMDALIETFRNTEKSRFWGLSKTRRTSYSTASGDIADPVISAIIKAQTSVQGMAKVVGFAGTVFDNFTHQLTISTKGLSEDEILKAVASGVTQATDAFAAMIPGLSRFKKEGEGATDTLTRLVTSLQTINGSFDTLDYRLRYAGLAGADTASALADLFGGMDAFSSATSSYWQTFYSQAERQRILTRQATTALREYNVALPRSRDAYRALIETQDLTTEAGRKLWSVLVQMSGTMDTILPSVSGLTKQLERLQGKVATALDGAIDKLTALAQLNAQTAKDWYSVSDKVYDFISSVRGTPGSVTTKQQALFYNQTKYLATYAKAMRGNLEASQNITGYAQSYLNSVNSTARTREDAALAQARVLAQMGKLEGAATIEGKRFDVISGLQGKQVTMLEKVRDFIAAGNALSKEMIGKLQTGLSGLDRSIKVVTDASRDDLVKLLSDRSNGFASLLTVNVGNPAKTLAEANNAARRAMEKLTGTLDRMLAELTKPVMPVRPEPPRPPRPPRPATPGGGVKPTVPGGGGGSKPGTPALSWRDFVLSGRSDTFTNDGNTYARTNLTVTGPNGGKRQFTVGGMMDHSYLGLTNDGILQKLFSTGKLPAFAGGGDHRGGLRIVGENGPELEATGPSRIYNARQTQQMLGGSNAELIAEVRALRSELTAIKVQTGRTADSVRSSEKLWKKIDAIGLVTKEEM